MNRTRVFINRSPGKINIIMQKRGDWFNLKWLPYLSYEMQTDSLEKVLTKFGQMLDIMQEQNRG